jgi:hypothetical protein
VCGCGCKAMLRADGEIPLPLSSLYLVGKVEKVLEIAFILEHVDKYYLTTPHPQHCQVGSLAGAAHLLNNNAGVPRGAQ